MLHAVHNLECDFGYAPHLVYSWHVVSGSCPCYFGVFAGGRRSHGSRRLLPCIGLVCMFVYLVGWQKLWNYLVSTDLFNFMGSLFHHCLPSLGLHGLLLEMSEMRGVKRNIVINSTKEEYIVLESAHSLRGWKSLWMKRMYCLTLALESSSICSCSFYQHSVSHFAQLVLCCRLFWRILLSYGSGFGFRCVHLNSLIYQLSWGVLCNDQRKVFVSIECLEFRVHHVRLFISSKTQIALLAQLHICGVIFLLSFHLAMCCPV